MSNLGHHVLVFDSGVGGLSVVSEIRARLPGAYLSYAADDEFRPYGSKAEAELQARLAIRRRQPLCPTFARR